ncbi:MAG TPA: NAD(P)/FAD-dependent oxidoreductase [Isosphaeraceae bacterium]|nr:NAD(P)/FAD-dependent oxidoreductase [Isosphaeraceae bacterium]
MRGSALGVLVVNVRVEVFMVAATLDLDEAEGRLWDVVVVGAGLAGSLAARQIAAEGVGVLLVDRKTFPRPKVCGACLNGKALAVLDSVGLGDRVERLGGLNLSRFEVRMGRREAGFSLPGGKALTRDVLDEALVEEAVAAGTEFLPGTAASLEGGGEDARIVRLRSRGREVRTQARVVVVASGLAGLDVSAERGLRARVWSGSRIGAGCVVERFPEAYQEGTIHMAVGRSGYVGVVRVGNGLLNVAGAFDRGFVRDSGGPGEAARAVIEGAGYPPVPDLGRVRWLGTVGLTRKVRPVGGDRLFLIGDAAGYVEPFTGEGMGAALTTARGVAPLAVRAVSRWTPSLARDWARLYHRLVGRGQVVCRGLTLATRNPWVARGAFALSEGAPEVSRHLIHILNQPPVSFEAT